MVKKLRIDESLLVALDICQPHYQVLLIIYQKNSKCKNCKSEFNYMSIKNNQLIFKCLECKKNYNTKKRSLSL